MKINNIKQIEILWSESGHINYTLGSDENSDINKTVSPAMFDLLAKEAAGLNTSGGYDKTKVEIMTVDKKKFVIRIDITSGWESLEAYAELYL